MRIELSVRYARTKLDPFKKPTEEEKEKMRIERIIGKKYNEEGDLEDTDDEMNFSSENKLIDLFNPDNLEIFYKPYVIDTSNIQDFYPLDDTHTGIITKAGGELIPIKMTWDKWKAAWEYITGEKIKQIEFVDK